MIIFTFASVLESRAFVTQDQETPRNFQAKESNYSFWFFITVKLYYVIE